MTRHSDQSARSATTAVVTRLALGLLVGMLVLPACGPDVTDNSYTGTARRNYQQGMEAFEDEDFLEAVRLFSFVKNKFPYSKYAGLSELRIADSYYEQEKFAEAVQAYRTFVQGRPSHAEVPYAMWKVGSAFFEQLPSDFFILPPAHEKDQGATKDALRALSRYVERFPDHKHVPDAQAQIAICRGMLADHELYVAGFYLREERPEAARTRFQRVVSVYTDLPERWLDAAQQLLQLHIDSGEREAAVALARRVVETQPKSDLADEVRPLLKP
jgi:outer membrane protein assembly factor BamD